jgi:hypothetical protein
MTVLEFDEEGEDADCIAYRAGAIRQTWQAERDAVEEREHSTPELGS